MTFCKQLIDQGQENVVLLDIYNNPIKVEVESFYEEIQSRYFEVTNEYYVEYEKLRKARKVHKGFIRENDLLIDKNKMHILNKLSPSNRSKLVKHCQKIVRSS